MVAGFDTMIGALERFGLAGIDFVDKLIANSSSRQSYRAFYYGNVFGSGIDIGLLEILVRVTLMRTDKT